MFNKARTIEVTEFTSASVRNVKKGARPKTKTVTPRWSAVSVDPIRVADELVKTIHGDSLGKYSDRKLALMEATASSQRLTASKQGQMTDNLRLRECLVEHVNGLRDFSKSTRIGEYGQAICSIFVQDKLLYSIVMDFDVFCQLAGAASLSKKATRPDFVGWDGECFCLVESKAS